MLQVMNSNSWFPTMFDDFFNNDWMPKMKATAPSMSRKTQTPTPWSWQCPASKKNFAA